MKTMDKSLKDLFQKGLITLDVAISKVKNPEEFKKQLAGGPSVKARPMAMVQIIDRSFCIRSKMIGAVWQTHYKLLPQTTL
jgi:hypothetical protein